jgi:hypothetical protein
MDINGKNDPWCRVTWGTREARTRTVRATKYVHAYSCRCICDNTDERS